MKKNCFYNNVGNEYICPITEVSNIKYSPLNTWFKNQSKCIDNTFMCFGKAPQIGKYICNKGYYKYPSTIDCDQNLNRFVYLYKGHSPVFNNF